MRIEENDTQLIAYLPHDPKSVHLVLGIGISFVLFGLEALKSMRSGFGWLSALWIGLFFLFAWIIWRPLYSSSNGRIVFDRKDMFVHTFYPAFWSFRESCYSVPLKEFDGVQSYVVPRPRITIERRSDIDWGMNVLELVTKEPVRGKIVHRLDPFLKEGASKAEEEHPEITCLAQRVSCFLGIQNHGFLGSKEKTAEWYLHADKPSLAERMFL
ncbi:MAG: hypothetical protein Q4A28_07410 [Brachymonas sp.]|nr:hypothetical protein [Brachymonas sp.]